MKKNITLVAMTALTLPAFGQAITISSTDVPTPTGAFNCLDISPSAAANPTVSGAGSWDYSAYSGSPFTNTYATETLTYFTSAGINVNSPSFKTLTGGFGYNIISELAFNSTDVKEAGINILAQGYSLAPFTGTAGDTLIIPAQQSLLPVAKEIMHFPFTSGSAWSSVSKRTTNFTLTVSSFGLTSVPGQQVYYVHRSDTIAGYGSLRVYTPSGPSAMYSVLVDKIAQYAADSFYLAGFPAPDTLLLAFNVAQGQKSDTNYRYNFYRKGSFNYMLSYFYGGDASYTNPRGKYVDTDGVRTANAGVEALSSATYSTVLFPNPANGSSINLMVSGKEVHAAAYTITDMAGRLVQTGNAQFHQGTMQVDIDAKLVNGNYILTVTDDHGKIATEQFTVQK